MTAVGLGLPASTFTNAGAYGYVLIALKICPSINGSNDCLTDLIYLLPRRPISQDMELKIPFLPASIRILTSLLFMVDLVIRA